MSAALLGDNGLPSVGTAVGEVGAGGNPQSAHQIASAFAQYDAAKTGTPMAAAQAPHQAPPPAALAPPNPISGTPHDMNPASRPPAPPVKQDAAPGSEKSAQAGGGMASGDSPEAQGSGATTLLDIAASFAGEDGAALDVAGIGHVTHEINGKTVTLDEMIEGFTAMPDARQVVQQRQFLENEFMTRGAEQDAQISLSMEALAGELVKLKARTTSFEDPIQLAQLAQTDPNAYTERVKLIEADRVLTRNAEEVQRVQSKKRGEEETARTRRLADSESRSLSMSFPEWNDVAQGPKVREQITAYARGIGFSDQELSGLTDHRFILVLRDATMGSSLKQKGKQVIKSAADKNLLAPRPASSARNAQPGKDQNDSNRRAASFQKLTQSHSVEDAGVVLGLLA